VKFLHDSRLLSFYGWMEVSVHKNKTKLLSQKYIRRETVSRKRQHKRKRGEGNIRDVNIVKKCRGETKGAQVTAKSKGGRVNNIY
jgi:hypothetical protein